MDEKKNLNIVGNSWWISSRSRSGFDDSLKPIQQRLLIPLAAVLLLLVSGFFLLLVQQQRDSLNHSSQKALKEVSRELAGMVIEQSETLEALGQVF